MASSTENDCHKDPNFAVVCSFLDKYGESLGLPHISYSDLERYLQDTTNNVSRVLIDIHVRLLRRIGKSSVTSERFEKNIVKFCHHFSEFDAWEVESYGYKHANVKTKLRILKNLLECQFDYNLKFKEKVNESSAEEMRFLPIGRDKEGQAYWYFIDKDLNLLIYKEEQDDDAADTWQLVCSDRQELANLVNTLKIGALKEDEDKTSTESRSSKEGSPDKEMAMKEETENGGARTTVKKEIESLEHQVKQENETGSSMGGAMKSEKNSDPDARSVKQVEKKGNGKTAKEKDARLDGKVELNVSIERLSPESVEKYKKGMNDKDQSEVVVKKEPGTSLHEGSSKEQTLGGGVKEDQSTIEKLSLSNTSQEPVVCLSTNKKIEQSAENIETNSGTQEVNEKVSSPTERQTSESKMLEVHNTKFTSRHPEESKTQSGSGIAPSKDPSGEGIDKAQSESQRTNEFIEEEKPQSQKEKTQKLDTASKDEKANIFMEQTSESLAGDLGKDENSSQMKISEDLNKLAIEVSSKSQTNEESQDKSLDEKKLEESTLEKTITQDKNRLEQNDKETPGSEKKELNSERSEKNKDEVDKTKAHQGQGDNHSEISHSLQESEVKVITAGSVEEKSSVLSPAKKDSKALSSSEKTSSSIDKDGGVQEDGAAVISSKPALEDVSASSPKDNNLTSANKNDDVACSKPVQSELLKDPDKIQTETSDPDDDDDHVDDVEMGDDFEEDEEPVPCGQGTVEGAPSSKAIDSVTSRAFDLVDASPKMSSDYPEKDSSEKSSAPLTEKPVDSCSEKPTDAGCENSPVSDGTEKSADSVSERPAEIGGSKKPVETGGSVKPAEIGSEKPIETGGSEKPIETGGSEKPIETGGSEKPIETGGSEKPAEIGGSEKPVETGGSEKPAEIGGSEKPVETGGSEKPVETGGSEKPIETGGSEKPVETGGSEKPIEIGGSEKPVETSGSGKPVEILGSEKPAEIGGSEKPAEIGGSEKPAEICGSEKPAVSGSEKVAEIGGSEKPIESGSEKPSESGSEKPVCVDSLDIETERSPIISSEKARISGSEKAPDTGSVAPSDPGVEKSSDVILSKPQDTDHEKSAEKFPHTGSDKAENSRDTSSEKPTAEEEEKSSEHHVKDEDKDEESTESPTPQGSKKSEEKIPGEKEGAEGKEGKLSESLHQTKEIPPQDMAAPGVSDKSTCNLPNEKKETPEKGFRSELKINEGGSPPSGNKSIESNEQCTDKSTVGKDKPADEKELLVAENTMDSSKASSKPESQDECVLSNGPEKLDKVDVSENAEEKRTSLSEVNKDTSITGVSEVKADDKTRGDASKSNSCENAEPGSTRETTTDKPKETSRQNIEEKCDENQSEKTDTDSVKNAKTKDAKQEEEEKQESKIDQQQNGDVDQMNESASKTGDGSQLQEKGKSETPRSLKRAAPEPASDELIESEPNGKRARPTTRIQKTRGGRNAAARGRAARLAGKESESDDSGSVAPVQTRRGGKRGRGRGGRGRGHSRQPSVTRQEEEVKKDEENAEEGEEETSDQANGKRAKKKKPDSSSEALSEEEVTPAKKGRSQIQAKSSTRGAAVARGGRRGGGRGGVKASTNKKGAQATAPIKEEEDGSRRRSARVREMKARRPPTPSSPEEESSEPTEEDEDDEEEEGFDAGKNFLDGSFTPEEESGDEEFKPKGRNFQRQAARTIQEENEEVINDDTPCVKCGKYNHPEMILLCDKCDAGYHTACLRPPLMLIPDGDWFCPPCEHSMLVERLLACLQSFDIALKKKDRLEKRQERLAYVGISINNILHGERPVQVSEKFGHQHIDSKDKENIKNEDEEEGEGEEEEGTQSENSSSYESEDEVPERKFRSERLALRQAEKRSRRERHKRRKARAQSPELETFAKRTCRTRNTVSYQFKEFDELISNAIDDDRPIRKEKPPGRSRGKDMSNILGASDEEDEKIRMRDGTDAVPQPVARRKQKRKLTRLDSDEEEGDSDSEEFKLSEDEDSDATEVEGEEEEDGEDDDLTEENSDSGDWKPRKTWYNSRSNRANRRKKFVVDDEDYDSDENATKRRCTRNSTRGRVKYDDWDSEEEETEIEEEEEEEETSFSDFSSDDSRFTRKMKREKERRKKAKEAQEAKKNKNRNNNEESEESASDSSMVRKRKMLMKLVKKRRKDESEDQDTEEDERTKNKIKTRKVNRRSESESTSASFDEEDSEEEDSDVPRSKKKNVLRSSDEEGEEDAEKAVPDAKVEADLKADKKKHEEANVAVESEAATQGESKDELLPKVVGKRVSPSKAKGATKGTKRGENADGKNDWTSGIKDEPVPGKVRRVSGSDKEGAAEPNPPLEMSGPVRKAQPARRGRGASRDNQGEVTPEKKAVGVGNRRGSTDKQTRSGKKKKLPNFLNVPSGGEESDEGDLKPPAQDTAAITPTHSSVSSAQPMPASVQQAPGPPGMPFQPHPNPGPPPPGYPPNQHFGPPQGHQYNPAFSHGQVGPPHPRPGLSSPPHSMTNVSNTSGQNDAVPMAQMPPHYSAPPGHTGNAGPPGPNMRGPYPRYNGMPPHMSQGMPPHMMNQALEPGQVPPHMRPSHPPQQPSPHTMGHDQSHPGMMQQQWADHRAPSQPPAYGNAPRMPYPRDMAPRQPYYPMQSPPHSMGQYPPNMGPMASNPLTSMGQMTRNLSSGMKSPPPRQTSDSGEESKGSLTSTPDAPVKSELKQEDDKQRDTASPEKAPAKGRRGKATSPKSQSEKTEGEESSATKPQPPSGPGTQASTEQPSSTAPPPYQHQYMNSQQGFYMPQHYRMPYGGPNQGPMNPMQGMPPPHSHGQYMNPNHPYSMAQGHRPYGPPGHQQPGVPMTPTSLVSGQNVPPNSLQGQQSQAGMPPAQQMQPGLPPNPSVPANQQRPPMMSGGQQGPPGPQDASMRPPSSYPRPPGMPPNQMAGGPTMMPGHMPHQPSMSQGPQGQVRPPALPHNQQPPRSVQSPPISQPSSQRMPPPGQGGPGLPHTQQSPMNMPIRPLGNLQNMPQSTQGEQFSGQSSHPQGPQMTPYYPVPPSQPGVPIQPSKAESGKQQAQGEQAKTPAEPQGTNKAENKPSVSDAKDSKEQKNVESSSKNVKEEPSQLEEQPQPEEPPHSDSSTKVPPVSTPVPTSNATALSMPVSHPNDPNAGANPNVNNNRNYPPSTVSQAHPGGQGPPMPYYNAGPYYQPYGNMPPQAQHMHPQARWGPNMSPYGPRYGGHMYPPYGMGPESGNMNMMQPGQGMHGNTGPMAPNTGGMVPNTGAMVPNTGAMAPPTHSTPGTTPMGTPPHSAVQGTPPHSGVPSTPPHPPHSGVPSTPPHPSVQSTPPHPGMPQDFQAPRDQPASIRRRSSSTDSHSNVPPASANPEGSSDHQSGDGSNPQPTPSSVSSSSNFPPSSNVKSENMPVVTSPSHSQSSSSGPSSSTTTTTQAQSTSQPPIPTSSPATVKPATSENKGMPPEMAMPPAASMGPHSTWSNPAMNHHYANNMGQMPRMGGPGPYNVMQPYGPQGMMPHPQNLYMMGQNPRQTMPKSQGNFEQYQGHMAPPHGMTQMPGLPPPPMGYNGGYRPPYMPHGHEHPNMPPRLDFPPEMQRGQMPEPRPNNESAAPDSQSGEGNAVAPKAKRAKTQKKKDSNTISSPRGKGTRGRGRGRGGFMIDNLLQSRGAVKDEMDGDETGEMKDIVNYVATDEYIKQQTSL